MVVEKVVVLKEVFEVYACFVYSFKHLIFPICGKNM